MSTSKIIKDTTLFITNEDLKDHIHNIHNYIRNSGLGYGKKALELFSVLYGIKLIESKLDLLGISKEDKETIKFSNILKHAQNRKKDSEYQRKSTPLKIDDAIKVIEQFNYKELYKYLYFDIPTGKQGIKENVWITLLEMINMVPVGYEQGRVNLSGKVYEYFIGRDQTAISELGAYFSDRHITSFCFNKVKPTLNQNNMVQQMIDMYGGSGGFTLGYVSYLLENYDNINWKENINNIYHCDMEASVVNMTGLEMFALTNYFPKIEKKTFISTNSFTWEFAGSNNIPMKWFYIFTNPPYGGDKTNKSAEQIKRDKLITFIKNIEKIPEKLNEQLKQLMKESNDYKKLQEKQQVNLDSCSKRIKDFASTNGITTANDKESCSLILLMDCLAEGGTCCGILKEGVFFDGKYSPIRKVLIDNFNVTNVISVPQNAFENTSTKTSIIIFHNTGKTKKVVFSELVVELEEQDVIEIGSDGMVHMIKNKDEIKEVVEKEICTATYEMISKPTIIMSKGKKAETKERFDYSLNYKNYKDFKVVCPDGYELKKLGDICEIKRGTRIDSNFIKSELKTTENYIPIYGAGSIQGYTDINNRDGYNCILSRVGGINSKNCAKISYGKIYITDAAFSLDFKDTKYKTYLYNYLVQYYDTIFTKQCGNGSVQVTISAETLQNLQIPVPKDISKLKKPLESLEKLHQSITEGTEAIPQKEKAICDLIKKLTDEGTKDVDYETFKLGELTKKISGRCHLTSEGLEVGYYPLLSSALEVSYYLNSYDYDNYSLIFNTINAEGNVNVHYYKKFNVTSNTCILQIEDTIKNPKYLYYDIKNKINHISSNCFDGSTRKKLNITKLQNMNINVLNPAIMKKHKLQELFDEVDKIKETLETNKKEYNEQIDKLFDTKDVEEEKAVEVTIKTKTKKSKNKEVQEIEI
jgi:type I restriction-modification system DNA methylase subunit